MTVDNRDLIGRAFTELATGLDTFITSTVGDAIPPGSDWTLLLATKDRANGRSPSRYNRRDPHAQLRLLTERATSAFKPGWFPFDHHLEHSDRGIAIELREVRNRWAHNDTFNVDDTYRALDSMERLLRAVGAHEQAERVMAVRSGLTGTNSTSPVSPCGPGAGPHPSADAPGSGVKSLIPAPGQVEAAHEVSGETCEVLAEISLARSLQLREEIIPLPGHEDGYRSVLVLGTTGAGKTTLIRQLLGTDPKTERFPTTSTAKTTIADTEFILTDSGDFRVVATFVSRTEVMDRLRDNVHAAARAVVDGRSDTDVTTQLLDHVDQRFRLSYILGRPRDLLDLSGRQSGSGPAGCGFNQGSDASSARGQAPTRTEEVLTQVLRHLRDVCARYLEMRQDDGRSSTETAEEWERLETGLDEYLRRGQVVKNLCTALLGEIEQRFQLLDEGHLSGDEWPSSWHWTTRDRSRFIQRMKLLVGNDSRTFGALLTPLVDGIRVSGAFHPSWAPRRPRLVIIDSEGLGHTMRSVASLPEAIAFRLNRVDSILLVDNATMPMQAAAVAAFKNISLSGNINKLGVAFTHFDQVYGDNLDDADACEEHLDQSVKNVTTGLREYLGVAGQRQLETRVFGSRYFLSSIHKVLDVTQETDEHSVRHLLRLLGDLTVDGAVFDDHGEGGCAAGPGSSLPAVEERAVEEPTVEEPTAPIALVPLPRSDAAFPSRSTGEPVDDHDVESGDQGFALPISTDVARQSLHRAGAGFRSTWQALLGLRKDPDVEKVHWTKVKALCSRVCHGEEAYDDLKPVADLHLAAMEAIYQLLRDERQQHPGALTELQYDKLVSSIMRELWDATREDLRRLLIHDHKAIWAMAYDLQGTGSTSVRARLLDDRVFEDVAPVRSAAPRRAVTVVLANLQKALDTSRRHSPAPARGPQGSDAVPMPW